jgi:imidazolonepropionase-like amidohydrolase
MRPRQKRAGLLTSRDQGKKAMPVVIRIRVSLAILLMVLACIPGTVFATDTKDLDYRQGIAFTHVNVIPMDREQVLADQTVLIVADRIRNIGPAAQMDVPAGFHRIDATGQYLLPAYCDMHTHVLGEAWNMFLAPEDRISATDLDMEAFLFPYLANGVTTIQVLSATPDHIGLRESIASGEILGPRLVLASMIDGPDKAWPPPLSTWVATAEEARQAVLEASDAGYDAMKVYSFLDPASYEAIIATARDTGIDVIGHIPVALSVEHIVASGQRLIAHAEEVMKHAGGDFSETRVDRFAATIAGGKTWLVPTLVTTRSILDVFEDQEKALSRPETRFFQHPMQQGVWSFITQNLYGPIPTEQRQFIRDGFEQFQIPLVRNLNQRGVKLLAGTDTPLPSLVPGFALHRELEDLVAAGLSPYEAMRSSTTHPFEYLGELDEAGTIQAGKLANLVLLEENPLLDISNSRKIEGIVIKGRWFSGSQIRERLELIATSSK